MVKQYDLDNQAADLAFNLLRDSGFESPPVNPYSVAARCGIYVTEVAHLADKASRLLPGSPPRIELNSKDPHPRRCFWLAYSLMNHLLPLTEATDSMRHKAWTVGATELMMPADWFREIGELTEWDLYQLRHEFAFSSHESVARRVAAMVPVVVTVFDNGAATRRFASEGVHFPPEPQSFELKAYAEAAKNGPGNYEVPNPSGPVRSYYIRPHRNQWQRIIVVYFPK